MSVSKLMVYTMTEKKDIKETDGRRREKKRGKIRGASTERTVFQRSGKSYGQKLPGVETGNGAQLV